MEGNHWSIGQLAAWNYIVGSNAFPILTTRVVIVNQDGSHLWSLQAAAL